MPQDSARSWSGMAPVVDRPGIDTVWRSQGLWFWLLCWVVVSRGEPALVLG